MIEASWVDVSPKVSTHPASCRLWIVSPGTKPDPRAQFQAVPSEKALLTHFCAAVCRVDPDILVGHGLAADLNLVTSRMTVRVTPTAYSDAGRQRDGEAVTGGQT